LTELHAPTPPKITRTASGNDHLAFLLFYP